MKMMRGVAVVAVGLLALWAPTAGAQDAEDRANTDPPLACVELDAPDGIDGELWGRRLASRADTPDALAAALRAVADGSGAVTGIHVNALLAQLRGRGHVYFSDSVHWVRIYFNDVEPATAAAAADALARWVVADVESSELRKIERLRAFLEQRLAAAQAKTKLLEADLRTELQRRELAEATLDLEHERLADLRLRLGLELNGIEIQAVSGTASAELTARDERVRATIAGVDSRLENVAGAMRLVDDMRDQIGWQSDVARDAMVELDELQLRDFGGGRARIVARAADAVR